MSDSPWARQSALVKEAEMGADPWSINYFAPPSGAPSSPATGRQYKRPVPEIDTLYAVQKALIKALAQFDQEDTERARTQVENGYKSLNRFLRTYG